MLGYLEQQTIQHIITLNTNKSIRVRYSTTHCGWMVYHSLPVSPLWMNKWVGVASRLCRGCWRHGLTSLPLALCAATPYTWYRPTHTSRIHDVAGADTLGAVDSSSSWRKRTTLIDPTPAWRQPLTSQMWRYRTEHMTLHDLPGYSL